MHILDRWQVESMDKEALRLLAEQDFSIALLSAALRETRWNLVASIAKRDWHQARVHARNTRKQRRQLRKKVLARLEYIRDYTPEK